ncbi:hypothetical protein NQ318_004076 [Aromia moschata]|uniref:Uncharacterized protein n=1 Tax=Aromia moschata TaxID=1265417 RepID=A0AAV8ZAF6_9CUCU|nr:hypothetical protein NQ318_004076 [Aromia moschata]
MDVFIYLIARIAKWITVTIDEMTDGAKKKTRTLADIANSRRSDQEGEETCTEEALEECHVVRDRLRNLLGGVGYRVASATLKVNGIPN